MNPKTVYCEECVEEIPNDDVYWEDERMYCGRCGSELEISKKESDVFDTFTGRSAEPLYSQEDEEYDEGDEEEELVPDDEKTRVED